MELPPGKSSCPDRFAFEFHKWYSEDLLPLYHKMLTEAYEACTLPLSQNQVIITLMLIKIRTHLKV